MQQQLLAAAVERGDDPRHRRALGWVEAHLDRGSADPWAPRPPCRLTLGEAHQASPFESAQRVSGEAGGVELVRA